MRVIISPTTSLCDDVLARLRSWSQSGMLEPFIWWPTPYAEATDGSFDVQRIARGESHQEALSKALTDVTPDDIRLVAFYPASRGESFDARFADAVENRVEAASEVIAFRPGAPVRATMIAAPAAVGQHVTPALFRAAWSANVLVAPEDRRVPESSNVLADTSAVLPSHAAHALATIADLWVDPRPDRDHVIDLVTPRRGGPNPVLVVPARCYTRIVDLGYLPDHVAAEVFQPREGSWPNPDRNAFDRVDNPNELVHYVTRKYLHKHEDVLGLTPYEPIPMPTKPRLSILDALKWLWEELVRTIKRKPFEIAEGMLETVVNRAADIIEKRAGPDRPFDVRRWRDRASSMEDLSELRDDLQRPLVVPDGAAAEAWTDLQKFAYGLVDGTPLPTDIDAGALKLNEKRLVVTEPRRIVPDPTKRPARTDALPDPRACDPLNLRAGAISPTTTAIDADDGTTDDADVLVDTKPLDPAIWAQPHRHTPIWMVGESIADALAKARAMAVDPPPKEEKTEEQKADEAKQRKQAERKEKRAARISLLLGVGAPFLLAVLASWAAWTNLTIVIAPVAQLLIVGVFAAALIGHARRQKARREQKARDALQQDLASLNATLERALRKGDAIRLDRRYREYLDWAEIIGYVAHYPWVGEPLRRVDVRSPIDTDSLPSAMEVAIGRTEPRVDALRQQGQKQLFRPRWLSSLYRTVETSVMDDLREAEGQARGGVVTAKRNPAADTSQDPESDRRQVLAAVRAGTYRHLRDNEFCAELLTFIDGLPLDFATDGVVPTGDDELDDAEPLPPATAWFSPPENLPELADVLRPSVVRIDIELATGEHTGGTGVVIAAGGLIATARHVIDQAANVTVTYDDGTTSPAQVTRAARATDVAVITAASAPDIRPALLAEPGVRPEQGQPVVTLGHPLLQEGEATLAWGLITATDRDIEISDPPKGIGRFAVVQATYHSVGGASGSPVFDLDGRLLGIHSAGSVDTDAEPKGQYLSFAVPTDDLHSLLAAASDDLADLGVTSGGPLLRASASWQPERVYPEPSEFLDGLITVPATISFLPDHWADPTRGRPLVEACHPRAPELEGEQGRIGRLAGPTAFLTPIRLAVHRVEIAAPQPPDGLACCKPT